MKKRSIVISVVSGVLLLGVIGSFSNQSSPSLPAKSETVNLSPVTKEVVEKPKPTCDGTVVTASCTVDGINYISYVYQPAVAEKSHTETVTTYKQEITSYCTLCADGTYSPSCATGRGACSHHGGVAQWNAPRYSNVPEYTTKIVIDAPAQAAYYNKIPE